MLTRHSRTVFIVAALIILGFFVCDVVGILNNCIGSRSVGMLDQRFGDPRTWAAAVLLATMCVYSLERSDHLERITAFGSCAFVMSWYQGFYLLSAVFRECVQDHNCSVSSVRSNSISGHALMYLYYLLTMGDILFNSRPVGVLSPILYSVYVLLSGLILYKTITGGFHTPRQMLIGFTFGIIADILCHVAVRYLTTSSSKKTRLRKIALVFIPVYCACLATAILILLKVPLPITTSEVVKFACAVAISTTLMFRVRAVYRIN